MITVFAKKKSKERVVIELVNLNSTKRTAEMLNNRFGGEWVAVKDLFHGSILIFKYAKNHDDDFNEYCNTEKLF